MDSNTAHSELNVSKDKTSVTHREPPHDTEERFDHYPRILGPDPFASGKHYWEVDVGVKTAWDIGIAQKSVDENTTTAHPNIYWAVLRKDEKAYKAVGSNGTTRNLSLSQIPEKVGVYLDCEEQTLSFYNPESQSLLHTAPGISGDLYPLFSPGLNQRGKNLEPLKICPLQNIRGDKVSL